MPPLPKIMRQVVFDSAGGPDVIRIGEAPVPKPGEGKDPAAVALGRKGGLKGGKARWEGVSARKRSEAGRKAARARWKKSQKHS